MDARVTTPMPEVLTNYERATHQGKFRKGNNPPMAPAKIRNTRGPVFFKLVRVQYDKETQRLRLSEGEFVRSTVSSRTGKSDEKDEEYDETMIAMEKMDELTGEIIDQAKTEIIKLFIPKDYFMMTRL